MSASAKSHASASVQEQYVPNASAAASACALAYANLKALAEASPQAQPPVVAPPCVKLSHVADADAVACSGTYALGGRSPGD